MNVTITVSEPYTLIAGGYTGMRPVSRLRDYSANVLGTDFKHTSKSAITRAIRAFIYREESRAGFLHIPVRFTFTPES